MNATDVSALMAAVAQLAKMAEPRNTREEAETSPTAYRFGSLGVGVLLRAESQTFYVSAGDKPQAQVPLTLEELNQVGTLTARAADKIRELEREYLKRTRTPG